MDAIQVCCALCCFLLTIHTGNCIEIRRMSSSVQCSGQVVSVAHRYRTQAARSAVDCAALCRLDGSCVSVVFDVDRRLCHFGNARARSDCSNMEAAVGRMKYYETLHCECEGALNPDGTNYVCPDSCPGNNNDTIIQGCEDLPQDGTFPTDAYWIKPALSPDPFLVQCLIKPSLTRTRIMRRRDANEVFNRTFREYRDGFGQVGTSTRWVGLERIHQITNSRSYQLIIQIQPPDMSVRAIYYDFVVNDEASGYSFSFSSVGNTELDDCLSDLIGAPFSTYDVDNDGSDSVNCALLHGGGWWFKGDNCSSCNPLGPVLPTQDGLRKGVVGEAFWAGLGDIVPLSSSFFLVAMP